MKRVILLSVTNLVNSPVELHTYFEVIRPDQVPDFVKFANRYCDPKKSMTKSNTIKQAVTMNCNSSTKIFAYRRLRKQSDIIERLPKVQR
jgi:hypothetical protein